MWLQNSSHKTTRFLTKLFFLSAVSFLGQGWMVLWATNSPICTHWKHCKSLQLGYTIPGFPSAHYIDFPCCYLQGFEQQQHSWFDSLPAATKSHIYVCTLPSSDCSVFICVPSFTLNADAGIWQPTTSLAIFRTPYPTWVQLSTCKFTLICLVCTNMNELVYSICSSQLCSSYMYTQVLMH
jgi:hypothetical protein